MRYRCVWDNDSFPGYVVYRHFDDLKCTTKKMVDAHKVAEFVCEAEADDYCAYRNEMMLKYSSDEVFLIVREGVPS